MRVTQLFTVLLFSRCFLPFYHAQDRRLDVRPKGGKEARQTPFPPGVEYHPGLTYSRPLPRVEVKLDLARPRGKGPFPAVLFLHGGGWVSGCRKTYLPRLAGMAEAGYVAATVSYRLAPRHPFPAAVHDVKCAVRWLRANAGRYGIDPSRIGVIGFSAGGNLACLLGTTDGNAALEGNGGAPEQSSRVQAVICYYGLTDLDAMHQSCERRELPFLQRSKMSVALTNFLGGTPRTQARRYTLASPVTHVTAGATPTLLIHGTRDDLVPLGQSVLFEERMRKVGAEVELLKVDGAGHNFDGEYEKAPKKAVLRFLDRHLKQR
jgi:acetyl esterase/lipase